ncbi:MAG: hypothetical protein C3F11_05680 [Methylocystaceae bacterium]|nr:MAG: hypothetical protein C3F11_05680 [Methylocystaceae bacterium]
MSWTVSDEQFSAYSHDVLRARPLGSLAASAMGVVSIAILAGALLFVRASPVEVASSSSPPVAAPPLPTQVSSGPAAPARGGPSAAIAQVVGVDLDAPEFAKEKKSFSVQRPEPGGGRQDTLVFGEFESGKPYLRLDILQTVGEKLGNSDFYLDMARHAARADLAVTRIAPPVPLTSRFGAFESADIRVSQIDRGGALAAGGERNCLAVRLLNAKLSIEIAGLACGAAGKPFDRRATGCVLDRLQYVVGSDNRALEQFFRNAEPERGQGCVAAPAAPPAKSTEAQAAAHKKRAAAARR